MESWHDRCNLRGLTASTDGFLLALQQHTQASYPPNVSCAEQVVDDTIFLTILKIIVFKMEKCCFENILD